MKTKVQTWGHSLALRIPRPFAAEVGIESGTPVELSLEEGKLVISPEVRLTRSLEKLLQEITPENIHGAFDTGPPVGREVW